MLTKCTRTTEDYRGCEFHYAVYKQVDRVLEDSTFTFCDVVSKTYVCVEFPNLRARSLKELKELVSNL